MEPNKLNVVVDDASRLEPNGIKQARGDLRGLLQKQGQRILEMELETLAGDIDRNVRELVNAIGKIDITDSKYQFESISFTLGVTATGEVALFSALKAASSPNLGITFTIRPVAEEG